MRKIRSLRIDRLELEKTYKRHYPLGEQVAPLVGFSGRDGYGLEGLEKSYNSILTGKPLKERVLEMVQEAQYKGLKSWNLVKTQKISTSPLIVIFNILHISISLKPLKIMMGLVGQLLF